MGTNNLTKVCEKQYFEIVADIVDVNNTTLIQTE